MRASLDIRRQHADVHMQHHAVLLVRHESLCLIQWPRSSLLWSEASAIQIFLKRVVASVRRRQVAAGSDSRCMAELSESDADEAVTPVKKRGGIADKLAAGLSAAKLRQRTRAALSEGSCSGNDAAPQTADGPPVQFCKNSFERSP